ncbi:MAG: T9SS type A sorting domain-containing protein [Bacteroidetes bacterium]|nr:T9SS type A sorting domain-containing protein [Bacteroidota bacterium]
MKTYFLTVFFAMTLFYCGYSQSISLADSTGPLANNANITKQGHNLDDEIASHIFVRNNTDTRIDVIVKKVEISLIPGSMNTFCWGLCFPPDVYVSPPKTIEANTTDSIDFSGHYNPLTIVGESVIRYVFYNGANPNDSVCVNVTYNALEVGVQNKYAKNTLSGAYPNPANSTVNFEYSLNSGVAGSVIIRNLLGTVVKSSALTGSEGNLSIITGDLPEGIYFYSLDVDGKALTTRKLIVRH